MDLNPAGFTFSQARGISGGQQVGYGFGSATGGDAHALLWSGTAASALDLDPAGFTTTNAWSVANGQQVGYGSGTATGGNTHALLWFGSALGFVDLHDFVSAGFTRSEAWGIDGTGTIVGAVYDSAGTSHAALWQVVASAPEPLTLWFMLVALIGLSVFARRRNPIAR